MGLQIEWVGIGVLWLVRAIVKDQSEFLVGRGTGGIVDRGAREETDDQCYFNRALDGVRFHDFDAEILANLDLRTFRR